MSVMIVTGGSCGIGRNLCEKLVSNGHKVAILDVLEKEGIDLCNTLNSKHSGKCCEFYKCDVSDEESFKKCFDEVIKKWGAIDVLINNAGFWDDSPQRWRKSIDVNLKGVISGSILAIEYMGKNHGGKGGTVINISSTLAFTTYPLLPIYAATKAGVLQFTRNLGTPHHYELHGVKFIAVCPNGSGRTNFFNNADKKLVFSDEIFMNMLKKLNIGDLQMPENVTDGILKILEKGENGSVWVIEDDQEERQINIPEIPVKHY